MKIRKSKKTLILSIVLVFGIVAYVYFHNKNEPVIIDNEQASGINFDPPTEEDKARAEANKERIEKRDKDIESQKDQPSDSIKSVTPLISYVGQYGQDVEVGGFVSDIYEDGGVCIVRFIKQNTSFSSQPVQAVKNANSVNCPVIKTPVSSFAEKGQWGVVLSYSSSKASGNSSTASMEIQ